MNRTLRTNLFVGMLVAVVLANDARAQAFPHKPLRAIVPIGVGGPLDILARAVSQELAGALGQPVIVENKPGADGIIGVDACAKAPADGHTLCVTQMAPISISPFIQNNLPYDPQRDLVAVAMLGQSTGAIAVNASVRAENMMDLIELSKSKPGALNWGSWGNASISFLYLAWIQRTAGARFESISYKTSNQTLPALASGEIQVLRHNPGSLLPLARSGKIRVIAIAGGTRLTDYAGARTLKEQGFELDFPTWFGVLAPAGTPQDNIRLLNRHINAALTSEKIVERVLKPSYIEPEAMSSDEFAALLRRHRELAGTLVKYAGIKN